MRNKLFSFFLISVLVITLFPLHTVATTSQSQDANSSEPLYAEDSPIGVDVVSTDKYTISGRVINEAGQPVAAAYLELFPESITTASAYTHSDAEGYYIFTDVKPDSYHIRARNKGYLIQFYLDALYRQDATAITIVDSDIDKINFTLSLGGSISGRVTDAKGQPVRSAYVYASAVSAGQLV